MVSTATWLASFPQDRVPADGIEPPTTRAKTSLPTASEPE